MSAQFRQYLSFNPVKNILASRATTATISFIYLFLFFCLSSSEAATPANAVSPLGTNLNSVSYWSSEQPFLNIFKTGGGWITQTFTTWDTLEGNNIPLDSNGYPTRLDGFGANGQPVNYTRLGMLLERQVSAPYYPAGQYVVLYDGDGTLAYGLNATLVSSSPGRDVFKVTNPSSAGILVQIKATNPLNYIRNIRIVLASQENALNAGQLFNPTLLSRLARFRTLRFMDWMRTNASTQSAWNNRPLPGKATYGDSNGVPLEIMAALCNTLQSDCWFNMPHMATDDYMAQFASLAHSLIAQNQNVYVEYSNETWNYLFSQASWVQTRGQIAWPAATVSGFEFNRNYFGMRTAQMCDIWKSVWGADSNRVVCVMAAQASNPWTASSALNCSLWNGAPCDSKHGIETVAIAPYFGYNVPNTFTLDQLFTEMMQGGQVSGGYPGGMLKQAVDWTKAYAAMASQYHVDLVAYEGGQTLVNSNDTALTKLYIAANKDPRMGLAYTTFLQEWKNGGGNLFNNFTDAGDPAKSGMWGALENIMNTSSPKYDAVISFIENNSCWWTGC
jgi:hypothetical protein